MRGRPSPRRGPCPCTGKRRRPKDALLGALIVFCAALTVAVLVGLIGYILINGLPHVSWEFLTGTYSARDEARRGILPMLISTLYIVVLTLLIVTPVGLSSAIYLTQYAKQGAAGAGYPLRHRGALGRAVGAVRPVRLHRVLPYAGARHFDPGGLPDHDALHPAPPSCAPRKNPSWPSLKATRNGALALGASRLRVVMGMVLPCAMPGVLTAVILGMGRIVGESAALILTSGLATGMPKSLFGHILNSGRTLTLHLYQTAREAVDPDAFNIAFATAAVLLILVFILNRLAGLLSRLLKKGG